MALHSPEKERDGEGPPFRIMPFVDLQALVLDLGSAIEELRYEIESLKERVQRIEDQSK